LGAKPLPLPELLAKGLLLGLLAVVGGRLALAGFAGNAAGEHWLHLINLPFHEFGHLLFRPLGRFLATLGGSLTQLLVPLLCLGVLLGHRRDPFGASVAGWWLGENLLDIAPYIADARRLSLPLLGGNTGQTAPYGFHDWDYLLTETGLLRADQTLARLAHGLGALLMVGALAWGGLVLWRGQRLLARKEKV
jgi:hypothetical protein